MLYFSIIFNSITTMFSYSLLFSCVFVFVVKCNSFLTPVPSIKDAKSLEVVKQKQKKVILFTGNGCRACIRFKKKFNRLLEDFPEVPMFEVKLNDMEMDSKERIEIMKYSNQMGIRVLPTLLIASNEDICCISGVKSNYDKIDKLLCDL